GRPWIQPSDARRAPPWGAAGSAGDGLEHAHEAEGVDERARRLERAAREVGELLEGEDAVAQHGGLAQRVGLGLETGEVGPAAQAVGVAHAQPRGELL